MTPTHFVPTNDADHLALTIAEAFHDERHLMRYRRICATHERSVVYVAYREAMDIPIDKVKKSRAAIFFYLINEYDNR